MSFFEMEPPKHLDDRILKAADKVLAENKGRYFRKMLLNWFAIPVGALAGFALFFKVTQDTEVTKDNLQVAEFLDWNEIETEEQDLIADLEIIEDLETLEKWEES